MVVGVLEEEPTLSTKRDCSTGSDFDAHHSAELLCVGSLEGPGPAI